MPDPSKPLTILLVRHSEPLAPDTPGFDEYTRPLSAKGLRDAVRLAELHSSLEIDAVYSSPYLRARQTVAPIANARGLAIETIDDLRERLLSPVPLADWRAALRRSWQDFDCAAQGGESSRVAQARAMRVLEYVRARHESGGRVMLASHGNLIALALHRFEPAVGYAFWEAIPMPAVFTLTHDGTGWRANLQAVSETASK